MNNLIAELKTSIPELIKNTHLHVSLEGWPAAASIFAICMTVVSCTAIAKNNNQDLEN